MAEQPLPGGFVTAVVRAGDTQVGQQMRLICDAYGLRDRGSLIDAVLWWQDRCWRGIEATAAAGDPAMTRLRDNGTTHEIQRAFDWVARHRTELSAQLDS